VVSFVRGAWGGRTPAAGNGRSGEGDAPITDPSSDQVIILKMR